MEPTHNFETGHEQEGGFQTGKTLIVTTLLAGFVLAFFALGDNHSFRAERRLEASARSAVLDSGAYEIIPEKEIPPFNPETVKDTVSIVAGGASVDSSVLVSNVSWLAKSGDDNFNMMVSLHNVSSQKISGVVVSLPTMQGFDFGVESLSSVRGVSLDERTGQISIPSIKSGEMVQTYISVRAYASLCSPEQASLFAQYSLCEGVEYIPLITAQNNEIITATGGGGLRGLFGKRWCNLTGGTWIPATTIGDYTTEAYCNRTTADSDS